MIRKHHPIYPAIGRPKSGRSLRRIAVALCGCVVLAWASVGKAKPWKGARVYVSARAYWHYMQAVQAWMRADIAAATESLRVALVYDPDSPSIRARWAELKWCSTDKITANKLRGLIRRAPEEYRLHRLLGLDHWHRGKRVLAAKTLGRALRMASKSAPEGVRLVLRDLSFLLISEGQTTRALSLVEKYGGQAPYGASLRIQILRYAKQAGPLDCLGPHDGAHICKKGFKTDVQTADNSALMRWDESLEWGSRTLHEQAVCGAGHEDQSCARFQRALKRLALPLANLGQENYF
jgi:hypothetical protein